MKFSCEKSELFEACMICAKAVPSKSTITALEGYLLTADENLRVTGFNLKEGIYRDLDADVEEPGRVVLNMKLFNEIIRRMPEGKLVVTVDDKFNVTLKCGKSNMKIKGQGSEDYPDLPSVNGTRKISLPQNLMRNMITKTLFAASDNDMRPIYMGALFDIVGDSLSVVAVDGFRLARREEKIEKGTFEDCKFVVPATALSDIEKICTDDPDGLADIDIGDKHICFTIDDTVIISRKLEGDFIDHRKNVPTEFKYKFIVNRAELMQCISRCSTIIDEKNKAPVRITFNDDKMDILCYNTVGRVEDVCLMKGDGQGIEIGFNDKYLLDALKAINEEEVSFNINSAIAPATFTDPEAKTKYDYMVLPVRIRSN